MRRQLVGMIVLTAHPTQVENEDVVSRKQGGDLDVECPGDLPEGLDRRVLASRLDLRDSRLA